MRSRRQLELELDINTELDRSEPRRQVRHADAGACRGDTCSTSLRVLGPRSVDNCNAPAALTKCEWRDGSLRQGRVAEERSEAVNRFCGKRDRGKETTRHDSGPAPSATQGRGRSLCLADRWRRRRLRGKLICVSNWKATRPLLTDPLRRLRGVFVCRWTLVTWESPPAAYLPESAAAHARHGH